MKEKSDDPQSVDFVPTMFKKFEGADFSYIPWRPIKKFIAWCGKCLRILCDI